MKCLKKHIIFLNYIVVKLENNMFKFLKLYDVGYKKIRVGPKKDGGYILLKEPSKNIKNSLSFGVEDNIDFANKTYKSDLKKFDLFRYE